MMWQHQTRPMAIAFLVSWIFMWFVIVTVMCCGCACGPQYPREYTEYTQTVKINVQCIDLGETPSVTGWYGSGVIISSKTLLTAGHVAALPAGEVCSVIAVDWHGYDHVMSIGFVDVAHDIASMHVVDKPFNTSAVEYGFVPPAESIVCTSTGYPDRIHHCGKIHGWYKGWATSTVIVEPGNSGSPVWDSFGRLIGISVHYVKSDTGVYLGSHFTPIANMIHHLPELLKE